MENIGRKVTSGLIWNYAERLLAQFVSLIVSIILARLISPDQFGAISIVTIMITICNIFISNGFGNALIQAKDANKDVFNALFYMSFFISLVLYTIIFILAPSIASFYRIEILTPVIRVMGIRLPIASLNTIQHAYLVRRLEFKKFFITTLFGTIISAFVGIGMAICGMGIWALVAQYLTNVSIDTILLHFTCGWKPGFNADWNKGKRLLPFGAKILGAALISNIYEEISGLFIGKQFSASDLAYYTKGKQFPSIVVTNINSSISRVLFSAMSKFQDDTERVRNMLIRSLKVNLFIIGPIMVGMFSCSDLIIRIVLSDKWAFSSSYMKVFCLVFMFKSIQNTYIQSFNAIGKSGISFFVQVVCSLLGLSSLLIAAYIFKDAIVVSYGLLVVQSVAVIICAFFAKKELDYNIISQITDVSLNIICLIVMGVAVYWISFINFPHRIITLFVQILSGVSIYMVLISIFHIDSYIYIKNIIKSYIKK